MSDLRQFGLDFSDCLVPAQHFMKCLEFSGIRRNTLIFTETSVLAGIPRNA